MCVKAKGTSRKLRVYAKARMQEISQGSESITIRIPLCSGHKWGGFLRHLHFFLNKEEEDSLAMVKFNNRFRLKGILILF